ncbi:MAG: PAS domain-containing protein [Promethearchaeota archaeon]
MIETAGNFRKIIESIYLGIIILQRGRLKYVNQVMAQINDYSIESMLDWTIKDMVNLVHPEDLPIVINQYKKISPVI